MNKQQILESIKQIKFEIEGIRKVHADLSKLELSEELDNYFYRINYVIPVWFFNLKNHYRKLKTASREAIYLLEEK